MNSAINFTTNPDCLGMELMPEQEWIKHIESIKKETEKKTKPPAKEELREAIINAVKKNIPGISKSRFGIFFSGGVDSSLIALVCKQLGAEFICYTVGLGQKGLKGSDDIAYAEKAAKSLGLRLKTKTFTIDELEMLFKRVIKALKEKDILSLTVGSVVYAAAELGKKDKINTFFSGLGSEDIFAGYHYHAEAKCNEARHNECWKGLKISWRRDLQRDFSIANALKIRILTPFLDRDVIKTAMGIDVSEKIKNGHKKAILREVAEEIGLPKEFAWRKKQAAQYGSRFDQALEKLAKARGFSQKGLYLKFLEESL